MPLTKFICPDGFETSIASCLAKCRMGYRCMMRSALMQISKQRDWEGVPSVTQLINGTLQAYLQITKDYANEPDEHMFSLIGSKVHWRMENRNDMSFSEVRLDYLGVRGTFDDYDIEDDAYILTDIKTSGSYKVAQALGMTYDLVEVDEVYKKATQVKASDGSAVKRSAGDKKMIRKWRRAESLSECADWTMQLNMYRMMLEDAGFPVKEMRIQSIVRDGGTMMARARGITRNSYLIPIKKLSNAEVMAYFTRKRENLKDALLSDRPLDCTPHERWLNDEGVCVKCLHYCPVRRICPVLAKESSIKNNGEV